MTKTNVPTILQLWKDSGLHEVLQGYPNATSMKYLMNYTSEVLGEALDTALTAIKDGRLQKRDAPTLIEAASRYAIGVAKRSTASLEEIQAEIDRAVAKENLSKLPVEQIRI